MGVQTIELYGPQFDFVSATEHYLGFVAGIGSGKTVAGCARAVAASQGVIGDQRIRTPNLGIITAPTYPMLRDATIRTFMEIAAGLIKDYNKSEHIAIMRNGSEILFRSVSDPETMRGPSISWWYGDEAALYLPKVWQIMMGRLRQYGAHGWAWITTTPKGRNWIWQKFVQAARKGYRLLKAATMANPYLDQAFVAGLVEEYVGDFAAQELLGEFVAFEGLIYPEFDRALHITQTRPQAFVKVVAGVDWGFVNPGVISVGGVDGDGRIWGLHQEYQRQRRIEEWANVALELRNTYRIDRFFCDPSEPKYIAAFNEKGCKAEAANNEVHPGIQRVKNRLVKRDDGKPRLIFSPDFAWTFSEFDQYQWRPSPKGEGFQDEPMKANDHCMDSIRYLVMGVDEQARRTLTVTARQTG
jgi:phage terminase large subunit-like protein